MRITILFICLFLLGCESSQNEVSIEGTWAICHSLATDVYLYQELIVEADNFDLTDYKALDNQCVNIVRPPDGDFNKITAKVIIDNAHISNSGLLIHDLTLINRAFESLLGTTEIPNLYTIIYLNDNNLYLGIGSEENDGSSIEKRHSEIDFDNYLTRK